MVLQRIGKRNHPYFKIVVMKDQGNLKGRYLEHVGYWQPREGKKVDRAIVINKNRVRYWLAHGTDPSQRVQYFLSLAGMMPAPMTKYGTFVTPGASTKYERPETPVKEQTYHKTVNLGDLQKKSFKYLDMMCIENRRRKIL